MVRTPGRELMQPNAWSKRWDVSFLVITLARQMTSTQQRHSLRETVAAFAPAFVPLGLGIWIAHYSFHFLIGATSIIPVSQEFFGLRANWSLAQSPLNLSFVGLVQVVALVGGFLWSMIIAQRAALRRFKRRGMIGLLPWGLLLLTMMMIAIQIFALPMEMRGTILFD